MPLWSFNLAAGLAAAALSRTTDPTAFGPVHALAFSSDGTALAVGLSDGEAQVWSLPNLELKARFPSAGGGRSNAVAFHPGKPRLAVGDMRGTVRVFDVASSTPVATLLGHTRWIHALAFSPDGGLLASASADRTIRLWSAEDWTSRVTLAPADSDWALSIAFAPGGERLASGWADGVIRVWETATGRLVSRIEAHSRWAHEVSWLDGESLVSGSLDGTVKVWEAPTGKLRRTLERSTGWIHGLSAHPGGRRVAVALASGRTKVVDSSTGATELSLPNTLPWILGLRYSPDGGMLAASSLYEHGFTVWDLRGGEVKTIPAEDGRSPCVNAVVFAPSKGLAAAASDDGRLRVWDMAARGAPKTIAGYDGAAEAAVITPDGRQLISSSIKGGIRVHDPASGRLIRAMPEERASHLSLSPDGGTLAAAGEGLPLRIYAGPEWRLERILGEAADLAPLSCLFSMGGGLLAVSDEAGTVRLYETRRWTLVREMRGAGVALSLSFGDGDRWLAAASEDLSIWETATGERVRVLESAEGAANFSTQHAQRFAAFHPTSKLLASATIRGALRVWDLEGSGEPALVRVRSLEGPRLRITSLAFTPEGGRVVIGMVDGSVRFWDYGKDSMESLPEK